MIAKYVIKAIVGAQGFAPSRPTYLKMIMDWHFTPYSALRTQYFSIGNLGGGRPLAKFAATLAGQSAERSPLLSNIRPVLPTFRQKIAFCIGN